MAVLHAQVKLGVQSRSCSFTSMAKVYKEPHWLQTALTLILAKRISGHTKQRLPKPFVYYPHEVCGQNVPGTCTCTINLLLLAIKQFNYINTYVYPGRTNIRMQHAGIVKKKIRCHRTFFPGNFILARL